jgi:hypothetical protein
MVLGIPRRAAGGDAKVQPKLSAAGKSCIRVHRELARTSRLETRAWIAIAISSAATLLLSFWLG